MTEDRPTISTHVLDTGSGGPAAGVTVTLWRSLPDGSEEIAGEAITDSDGRVRDLLGGVPLDRGAPSNSGPSSLAQVSGEPASIRATAASIRAPAASSGPVTGYDPR